MIVTILPSSTSFHAVDYNEHKVAKGVAELMEIRNFGYIGQVSDYTKEELVDYLQTYSSLNARIRKPQFHVAFSCRGKEMSHRQLLDFAHKYLKEMGYAEEGQPLLVYAHHDTDNNHIHVVTSRVAPDGRKIDHNNERVRSQEAIDRILGQDEKLRVEMLLQEAMEYQFSGIYQFRAIMETSGYECYTKDEQMYFKRGGKVVASVPVEEITAHLKQMNRKDRWGIKRLRAIIAKFQRYVGDRAELVELMKQKFGVDMIFFGSKDKPYGYMVVDHTHRVVYNGNTIRPVLQLCDFPTPEERIGRLEQFIDALLEENPRLTTREIYHHLWRQYGTCISKGNLVLYNKQTVALNPAIAATLNLNFRLSKAVMFCPTNQAERDVICAMFKIKRPDLLPLSKAFPMNESGTAEDFRIAMEQGQDMWQELRNRQLMLCRLEDGTKVCVDFRRKCVVTLPRLGITDEQLKAALRGVNESKSHPVTIRPIAGLLRKQGGSSQENREYEVGRNGYGEIDDERSLKR